MDFWKLKGTFLSKKIVAENLESRNQWNQDMFLNNYCELPTPKQKSVSKKRGRLNTCEFHNSSQEIVQTRKKGTSQLSYSILSPICRKSHGVSQENRTRQKQTVGTKSRNISEFRKNLSFKRPESKQNKTAQSTAIHVHRTLHSYCKCDDASISHQTQ